MKPLIFFLSLLCFISNNVYSQNYIWTKTTGKDYVDNSWSVAFDSQGNVVATGQFFDTVDFDPGPGIFNLINPNATGFDIFVQKLDPSGNLVWACSFGSTGYDLSRRVSIDGNDNIFIIGDFLGTVDFDPGPGVHNITATSSTDGYMLKLDGQGNFVWVKIIIGGTYVVNYSTCFDSQGNIYTTGGFNQSADFDPGSGTFTMATNSTWINSAGFIQKLDAQGNFIWAKEFDIYYLNTTNRSYCSPYKIAVDDNDDIYVVGDFDDTVDFDPGPGVYKLYGTDAWDGFIVKLHSDGSFVWAREIKGSEDQRTTGICFDAAGGCYVAGTFYGSTDADPGPGVYGLPAPTNTGSHAYLIKLDVQGNFEWAVTHPSTGSAACEGLASDPAGNVYMGTTFSSVCDVDPSPTLQNLTSNGSNDVGLCCYSPSGNLSWARSFGGTLYDYLTEIKLDNNTGNMYVTGNFYGTVDFNFDAGTDNHTSGGINDFYIMKFSVPIVWSIDEPQENVITVFPNPVQSVLQISSSSNEEGILEIFGTDGKLIFTESNFSPSNKNEIDVSALPNGMYLINLSQNGKITTAKFCKQ